MGGAGWDSLFHLSIRALGAVPRTSLWSERAGLVIASCLPKVNERLSEMLLKCAKRYLLEMMELASVAKEAKNGSTHSMSRAILSLVTE